MKSAAHPLPAPGLLLGAYPQRPVGAPLPAVLPPGAAALPAVRAAQARWAALDADAFATALHALRALLARDGWGAPGDARHSDALGCAAAAGVQALGRAPFDTQLHAAGLLLADRFVELATGEGKTYAAALAAAVAALAGVPVHVMTANDYLVQRDAAALAPLFARLGLTVGAVTGASTPEQRRAAYRCDVAYATAREVAFDHLRDGLAVPAAGHPLLRHARTLAAEAPTPQPLLRGLCFALLDEADSLLVDDASLPLVLSETHDDAQQRAACFQALTLARTMEAGRDIVIAADEASADRIIWLPAGTQRLDELCAGLDGAWHNRRHRQNLVASALTALHVLERDRHYLVRDGAVQLLDAQTGRVGPGRVWADGLQTLVELKEGCKPGSATTPRARSSVQGFFARYWRLAGTSGTLHECRRELRALYGREVVALAPRLPSRRVDGPPQLFADGPARRAAVLTRIAELHAQGRPVLVGCASVAESEALAQGLAAVGLAHQVLNARHDAAEAAIVARAGQPGAITVATQMAGRGTDIALGDGVAARGGLHVLCCTDSANGRLERQLVGRGARQGDPGSAEVWRCVGSDLGSSLLRHGRKADQQGRLHWPAPLLRRHAAWRARLDEWRNARQRRRLLQQDREWQRRLDFT